jgi:hypothetical protein
MGMPSAFALQRSGICLKSLARAGVIIDGPMSCVAIGRLESGCWDMARIESPLIGSGSQEEVDLRVQALLDLGTSRGYLTYEELNERLPDEVVSPDKLDSLLMMIDEMGIKLIDETDAPEHQQ